MERMQSFVNFIFYQVWCRAPKVGPFDFSLFDANPLLKEVITSFASDRTKTGDQFLCQIEAIYQSFAKLSRSEVAQFKRWYHGNNDLEKICINDTTISLARYEDIAIKHEELADQLGIFFKSLYSKSVLNLAALRQKIGDIDDHYQKFVQINKAGKCPFCGINDLMGEYHSNREAYDHYLPKALYPFNSINFRNLVPACHQCNSSYKTSKDPAYILKDPARASRRRAFFYPYKVAAYSIELQIVLRHSDINNLTSNDILLQFGPAFIAEEIETWKEVYGIEERYKAKLCGENDGMYWLTQVLDECQAYEKKPVDILAMRTRCAQIKPFADCNFLRMPFLDACQKVGIFNSLV